MRWPLRFRRRSVLPPVLPCSLCRAKSGYVHVRSPHRFAHWRCPDNLRELAMSTEDRIRAAAWMAEQCIGDPNDTDGTPANRIDDCPACLGALIELLHKTREDERKRIASWLRGHAANMRRFNIDSSPIPPAETFEKLAGTILCGGHDQDPTRKPCT